MIFIKNYLYYPLYLWGTDGPTMHKKRPEFINMNILRRKLDWCCNHASRILLWDIIHFSYFFWVMRGL